MNITIIYSLPTKRAIDIGSATTDEDTAASAAEVKEVLEKNADVTLTAVPPDDINGVIQEIPSHHLVFNMTEWTGSDGHLSRKVIGLLEDRNLLFTGCDSANFELTLNKIAQKKRYDELGIPTPLWQQFESGLEEVRHDFHFPVIIKVATEHGSIGLSQESVVQSAPQLTTKVHSLLAQYKEPVIAEEFVEGEEYHVPMVKLPTGVKVCHPTHIVFTKSSYHSILSFTARWQPGTDEFNRSRVAHAHLEAPFMQNVEEVGQKIFKGLGFRDYARIDLRITQNGGISILETNSNPGLSKDPEYELSFSLQDSRMTFDEFIWAIVTSALERR